MTAAESLVGREDEFDRVAQLLDARDELPAAIVFHGEAGIGKTSLWLAAVERAGAIGYRVLSSRPSETETSLSYAGLADLLGGRDRRGASRRCLRSSGARWSARCSSTETEAEADERAVAAAFLAIVRNLAGDQPLCLAIDDVQWLDAASLDAIGFALARLDDDPVASLLSLRGDVPSWLRRARIGGGPQAIELRGLSIGAMHELLRSTTRDTGSRDRRSSGSGRPPPETRSSRSSSRWHSSGVASHSHRATRCRSRRASTSCCASASTRSGRRRSRSRP